MCGTTLEWEISEYGVLRISGMGDMPDYTMTDPAPWNAVADVITSVLVESGVESIGNYAFSHCVNMERIILPETITKIGNYAFAGCNSMV